MAPTRPASPEPEKLELTVARLRSLVGEGQVGTPELRNSHRPDSFVMRGFAAKNAAAAVAVAEAPVAARLCLRRFRPPRYAQVMVVTRQPVRIAIDQRTRGDGQRIMAHFGRMVARGE